MFIYFAAERRREKIVLCFSNAKTWRDGKGMGREGIIINEYSSGEPIFKFSKCGRAPMAAVFRLQSSAAAAAAATEA